MADYRPLPSKASEIEPKKLPLPAPHRRPQAALVATALNAAVDTVMIQLLVL